MNISRVFDFADYRLHSSPKSNCFHYKKNDDWLTISSKEYIETANKVSASLLHLGIQKNDKIAVITENNNPNWHSLDIGILQIGAQNIPLYATLSSNDYEYIINHSDALYCFVSSKDLYKKVSKIKNKTQLKEIYFLNDDAPTNNWSTFLKLAEEKDYVKEIKAIKSTIHPTDIATIIYTSGTTGTPKGVVLSHENIVFTVFATSKSLDLSSNKNTRIISYLPICHIFERTASYYNQYMGFEIYFAPNIEALGDTIREVKPNYLAIVPRLLEKIYDKIVDKGTNLSGLKKLLFFWSLELASQYKPYQQNGKIYHLKLAIAKKLIFSKWQAALGGNLQFMVCGSAPLQPKLIRVFTAAGISVFEGYGMTESSPGGTINDLRNNNFKIGSVGKPIEGVTIKIATDGEILIKGKNVMQGYYKNEELTQKTIIDGYLHTGDIGKIDDEGFLYITDRKKEIFKTSGGKYIAPTAIESEFKQSRFIEQIMVIGEGEKMPAAFIQLNEDFVKEWALRKNIEFKDLYTNKHIIKRLQKEVDTYNKNFGKWEQIKKFEITPEVWSVENGLLTPTLKMKRKAILHKYRYLYEKIYK